MPADFLDLCMEAEEYIRDARNCETRLTGCATFNELPRDEKRRRHITAAIEALTRALEIA